MLSLPELSVENSIEVSVFDSLVDNKLLDPLIMESPEVDFDLFWGRFLFSGRFFFS